MTVAGRWGRIVLSLAMLALAAGIAGELWSRLDDFAFRGVPPTAPPTDPADLGIREGDLVRGRPNGQAEQFLLNEYGFRGPPMGFAPVPGCPRVAILGASEIMGYYYESPGHETVAQLRELLKNGDCVEIVNAAVWGMTNRKAIVYWRKWLAQFRPQWVVVYPSPVLYLAENALAAAPPTVTAPGSPASGARDRAWGQLRDFAAQSRFLQRIKDVARGPEWFEDWRNARRIEKARIAGKIYAGVPLDRLQAFDEDLNILINDIVSAGARPILVTHAEKLSRPVLEQDRPAILKYCANFPYAGTDVFIDLNDRANDAIRASAREHKLPLVEAAAAMNGHREWFGDLVHFNDDGAHVLATMLAGAIVEQVQR